MWMAGEKLQCDKLATLKKNLTKTYKHFPMGFIKYSIVW